MRNTFRLAALAAGTTGSIKVWLIFSTTVYILNLMAKRPTKRRGYGQFCGLARALDVVGDRWTLLIVRELLIGQRRFGELRTGLFGIATNLLSDRLRRLEADAIVERSLGAPEVGTRYALTSRGEALRPIIEELIRWSGPLMASGRGRDDFHPNWLAVALPALLPRGPDRPVVVGIHTQGTEFAFETGPAGSVVCLQDGGPYQATIEAEPDVILGLASGALSMPAAIRSGAQIRGDREALERAFAAEAKAPITGRSRS